MKLVCISDTHREFWKLKIPEADVLVHTGDIDCYEFQSELEDFNKWLGTVPCKHKIIVAGNHDGFIDCNHIEITKQILTNGIYLENESVVLDEIKFWGSPITPLFCNWYFMQTGENRKETFSKIPNDTDILITHGPPNDILDVVSNRHVIHGHVGCVHLARKVQDIAPAIHVFGHIHGSYGVVRYMNITVDKHKKETVYINASVMDEGYNVVNKPIEIYYYKETGDVIL